MAASATRVLSVLRALISGTELDRHDVAKLVDVKPAAADKYLRALEEQVPGVSSRRRGQQLRFSFDANEFIRPPTVGHAIAACLASSLAPLFAGTDYEVSLREVLGLLVQSTRSQREYHAIDRKFLFVRQGGEAMLPDLAGELYDLVEATLNSELTEVKWTRFSGEQLVRLVQPLSLAIHEHQLYFVARADESEAPFLIRGSRVTDVQRKERYFKYPPKAHYDPDRLFGQSIGVFISDDFPLARIELRLNARWSHYASTHLWHPSQQVFSNDDGSVQLRLHARTCPELVRWIRGFGADVEVLSPETLRATVICDARRVAAMYADEVDVEGN